MKAKIFFSAILLFFSFKNIQAQKIAVDTVNSVHRHLPNRAANMSAILPGLGQVYNKKYWKVPIIYGGAAALIYSISWNNREYQKYLRAYKLDSDTSFSTNSEFAGLYTVENLITLKDFYRRNRDLSVIGVVLLYTANIVDAYVDGHFFYFDVSDDLSLKVDPYLIPDHMYGKRGGSITGVSLTLNFK